MRRELKLIKQFRVFVRDTNSGILGVDIKDFEDNIVTDTQKLYRIAWRFRVLMRIENITKTDYLNKRMRHILQERMDLIKQDIKTCIDKQYFHKLTSGGYLLGREGDKLLHNCFYRLEIFFREWDRSITIFISLLVGGGGVALIWIIAYILQMIKSLKP